MEGVLAEPSTRISRRTRMPLTSRLSVVLAVALSVLATSCASQEPGNDSVVPVADPRRSVSVTGADWPQLPPQDYRWVGDRGVVVAVPDWWTTGDTECLLPIEDTVYVETGAITDCASSGRDDLHLMVSSLAVITTDHAHGERLLEGLTPDGELDGEPVLTGRECGWLAESVCRTVVAVPSRGVAFALHAADPGDVDPAVIRDFLTLLSPAWTTVPLALREGYTPVWGAVPSTAHTYARLLERSGFAVRVEQAERPDPSSRSDFVSFPQGTLLDIEPSPGSPIEEGGQVVLTVSPG